MKRRFLYFLALLIVISNVACNKNEPVANTNLWLPADLKSYFLFYPGSYWIMLLPADNYVDSVYVEYARLDTLPIIHPGSRETLGYKERLTVSYFSTFYGRRFLFEASGEEFCTQRGNDLPCFTVYKKNVIGVPDTVTHQSAMVYFPYQPNRVLSARAKGSNTLKGDPILKSYLQADSTYNNVLRVTVSLDETEQSQVSIRHFAPNVGLIRWQVPDWGFDWMVIRYKVVQTP